MNPEKWNWNSMMEDLASQHFVSSARISDTCSVPVHLAMLDSSMHPVFSTSKLALLYFVAKDVDYANSILL